MKLTGLFLFITGVALMAAGVVVGGEPASPRIDLEKISFEEIAVK